MKRTRERLQSFESTNSVSVHSTAPSSLNVEHSPYNPPLKPHKTLFSSLKKKVSFKKKTNDSFIKNPSPHINSNDCGHNHYLDNKTLMHKSKCPPCLEKLLQLLFLLIAIGLIVQLAFVHSYLVTIFISGMQKRLIITSNTGNKTFRNWVSNNCTNVRL